MIVKYWNWKLIRTADKLMAQDDTMAAGKKTIT